MIAKPGQPGQLIYVVTMQHGIHYGGVLAQALRQENVKVVAIHPGTSTDTKSVLIC